MILRRSRVLLLRRLETLANRYQVTLIYANANIKVGIESFCRIIGGLLWEGKVLANVWFVGVGYTTILDGLSFSQDMKLSLYYGVGHPSQLNIIG